MNDFLLIALVGLISAVILLVIMLQIPPCVPPLFKMGCYVKDNKILWCCD
jgi:hypothetical protein